MRLYDTFHTRRAVEARTGSLEQVAGLRRLRLDEGQETGVAQVQVRTGGGLSYYVSPDRGLDIGLTEFCGVPLSWQAPNGDVHPAYYDARGLEWLRTAAGGLLMTCGFTYAGAPSLDGDQELGLHGRAHHLPARQIATEGHWHGDEYLMRIAGTVEEAIIFGDKVRLTREIRSVLGENQIAITDIYENPGFEPAPLMLLYHFNFGFPLLSEATEMHFPSRQVTPRDADTPLDDYDRWQAPESPHAERVYLHRDLETDDAGWATASVHNPAFPLAVGVPPTPLTVRLAWNTATLPNLVQWRMAGSGEHVLGIEPTNCNVLGRAAARAAGDLEMLQPGEQRRIEITLNVTAG
ncbi:MAG: aldose 1-epimerase family protein [Litorilinea sp.]